MTAKQFRKLALALPEALEGSHMGHADFRVRKKIFATLGPDGDWAMVKLTVAEQKVFVRLHPGAFVPFPGGWGKRGCTKIILTSAVQDAVDDALRSAWRYTAPASLKDANAGEMA